MLLVNLIVSVPDIRKLVGRDSLAVVSYFNYDLLLVDILINNYGFVVSAVIDCVVYQIVNNLRNSQLVRVDVNILAAFKAEVVAVLLNQLCVPLENILYAVGQAEILFHGLNRSRLQLGKVEQIVYKG